MTAEFSAAGLAHRSDESSSRLMPFLRWGGAGIVVLAVSMAVGYFLSARASSSTEEALPASQRSPAASAPSSLAVSPAGAAETANVIAGAGVGSGTDAKPQWPLWEFRLQEPIPAREEPLTPVSWRLLGAALFDGRWHAIIQREGAAAPEYYKVGDKLAGGYVIQEVTQEDMTLRSGRREIVLAYIGSR